MIRDMTDEFKRITDKRIHNHIKKVLDFRDAKDAETLLDIYEEEKAASKNIVYDGILFITDKVMLQLIDRWDKEQYVPYCHFICQNDDKSYEVADNSCGQFFVEGYDSLEKNILYLTTGIDIDMLYSESLEECIEYLINEEKKDVMLF